jgi:glycosyltransferase involved in cell wall biosynthesis
MKISVCILTYNHEKLIEQAINSALEQKVNCDLEILIGDDCSSDNTPKIVYDFAKKHPDLVRPIVNKQNVGPTLNLTNLIKASTGDYIAILEGDDYWSDKTKLQTEVDFLEEHKECSAVFHKVKRIKNGKVIGHSPIGLKKEYFSFDDIIKKGSFIPTTSLMFRSNIVEFPKEYFASRMIADWPLVILIAKNGNLAFIDKVMACYRVNSNQESFTSWDGEKNINESIKVIKAMDKYTEHKYRKVMNSHLSVCLFSLAIHYAGEKNWGKAKDYAWKSLGIFTTSQHLPVFVKWVMLSKILLIYNLKRITGQI